MNPFWDYSLAIYRQPGIESACLTLQERYNANVNLLLWCCWLELRQIRLSQDLLKQALKRIALWNRQVVEPLRQARRTMARGSWPPGGDIPALLTRCKEVELAAEKVQQGWLYDSAQTLQPSQQVVLAGENIQRYLTILGVPDERHWIRLFTNASEATKKSL